MSTVFKYPDGTKSVTSRDRDEMPGRAYHLYAAFAHSWDRAPSDVWVGVPGNHYRLPNLMKDQAAQWARAFYNQGGS